VNLLWSESFSPNELLWLEKDGANNYLNRCRPENKLQAVSQTSPILACLLIWVVEGLIHVSELSWGRVQHPSDILKVGDSICTLVLQVCEENSRVALSLKRLCSNPWDALMDNHKPGDVVPATITSIMRFGAFARLKEGVEGLIHVSSIPQSVGQKDLEKVFQSGQSVIVRILILMPSAAGWVWDW
jgi:ribosomal protein S1